MKSKLRMTLAGMLLASALPAVAHHSFYAEFDANKLVRLEGTVIKMEWVNPHSWLHIAVENEQGETEEWKVEGGSPGVLMRLGWTRDSLPPGTKVIVNGFQAKDGSHRANSRGIEFPDGTVMEMGGSSRRAE
ncbi:MAG TPA: hypothetical protein GX696_02220 [Pseudomonadaceae bacterium]|nr:hypothetical protein [Pseudomonadaceae bacterium]